MRPIRRTLLLIAALLFLGLSWLWDHLEALVHRIVDWLPLAALKAAVVRIMDRLPPYPTLLVFLVPVILSEPIKLASIWFFVHKMWISGALAFAFAELLRFGLVAFIFRTCREKLLSIPWFARAYGWFVRAHAWAHGLAAPYLRYARKTVRRLRLQLRPKGRFLALMRRLRRRSRSA